MDDFKRIAAAIDYLIEQRSVQPSLDEVAAHVGLSPGERVSYAQLADAITELKAVRAVGNALAVNPIATLIPCHRVIKSSDAVGNYKWGDRRKRALLAWESAATQLKRFC